MAIVLDYAGDNRKSVRGLPLSAFIKLDYHEFLGKPRTVPGGSAANT